MTERWKPVVGWEGLYSISDYGRVRSEARVVPRKGRGTLRIAERIRRPSFAGQYLYPMVPLSHAGVVVSKYVHTMVLEAFHGPRPQGCEACHADGDNRNNRASNLRWDTPLANSADKRRHGTIALGVVNAASKLTESQVFEIRKLRGQGWPYHKIASRFSIATMTALRAARGISWSHLA